MPGLFEARTNSNRTWPTDVKKNSILRCVYLICSEKYDENCLFGNDW